MRSVILLIAAASAWGAADGPFCGNWEFASRKVDPPMRVTYAISGTELSFKSTSGSDEVVKLDGADHTLPDGERIFSGRRTGDRTMETTYKQGGKVTVQNTREVTPDGKEMRIRNAGQTNTVVYDRVGQPVGGQDPFTGEWEYNPDKSNEPVQEQVRLECKDGLVRRFSEKGDIVWEAKLDGSPHQGPRSTITARRVDERTVETTTTGNVKVVTRITVSPDGQTMTYTADRLPLSNPSKTVVTYKRVSAP